MGAWGAGTFDNDTACDWAGALEGHNDLALVERTVDKVLAIGGDYLEALEAEEALAAAEVLARLRGHWGLRNAYTAVVDDWVERTKLVASAELIGKATKAIERIVTEPSELLELWAESNELDLWKASVEELRERLQA